MGKQNDDLVLEGENGERIWYGKFSGYKWRHLPLSYLKMVVNTRGRDMDKAEAEIERRGIKTDYGSLDISSHAVDRVSQFCLDIWQRKRKGDEGLYAWTHRVASEAIKMLGNQQERVEYLGMLFVFEKGYLSNTLVTVIRDRDK